MHAHVSESLYEVAQQALDRLADFVDSLSNAERVSDVLNSFLPPRCAGDVEDPGPPQTDTQGTQAMQGGFEAVRRPDAAEPVAGARCNGRDSAVECTA